MLKKLLSDKVNFTKNLLFFQTRHNFTFNLRFLYELKHRVHLSKSVGFSIFDSVSFLLKFTFILQQKSVDYVTLKRHNSFQN